MKSITRRLSSLTNYVIGVSSIGEHVPIRSSLKHVNIYVCVCVYMCTGRKSHQHQQDWIYDNTWTIVLLFSIVVIKAKSRVNSLIWRVQLCLKIELIELKTMTKCSRKFFFPSSLTRVHRWCNVAEIDDWSSWPTTTHQIQLNEFSCSRDENDQVKRNNELSGMETFFK